MKIEHVEARSTQPQRALDWDNMLAVCVGYTPWRDDDRARVSCQCDVREHHCDTQRGNAPLPLDPARVPNIEERFAYGSKTGQIRPTDDGDTDAQGQIDVLNLNHPVLSRNRLAAIAGYKRQLARAAAKRKAPSASRADVSKLLTDVQTSVPAPPYAPAIAHYLRARLRQLGA